MRILVTGGKGQLGCQIKSILERKSSEISKLNEKYSDCDSRFTNYDELDITKYNDVDAYISSYKPDAIINCAAYTNVDGCERDRDAAFKVNAIGPRNLAAVSEKYGTKLLHVSTNYVFNREETVSFKEYDIPHPVSVYGKTKLLGEQYVRENCSRYFIVRTAWLYGEWGENFVYTIMRLAKEKGHIDVVNDQKGNPTYAEDLAHHVLKLVLSDEYGIYHCTGKGECSWYDFACKIVEYSGIACTVSPISSVDLNRSAKRPAYSSLDNMMLRVTVGDEMRHWEEALKSFMIKVNK